MLPHTVARIMDSPYTDVMLWTCKPTVWVDVTVGSGVTISYRRIYIKLGKGHLRYWITDSNHEAPLSVWPLSALYSNDSSYLKPSE